MDVMLLFTALLSRVSHPPKPRQILRHWDRTGSLPCLKLNSTVCSLSNRHTSTALSLDYIMDWIEKTHPSLATPFENKHITK